MSTPRVLVDFNEYDRVSGEVPIPRASIFDIERSGTKARDGLLVELYSADLDDNGEPADLVAVGRIRYDATVDLWIACVDPQTFRHIAHTRAAN